MASILVLVADRSRARFFKSDTRSGPLEEIKTLADPEGRLHEGDLTTGSEGHTTDRMMNDPRSTGVEKVTLKRNAEMFAKDISEELDKAVQDIRPSAIYVMANPEFLGHLRDKWSKTVKPLIAEETPKNVTTLSADEIREHLPDYV